MTHRSDPTKGGERAKTRGGKEGAKLFKSLFEKEKWNKGIWVEG